MDERALTRALRGAVVPDAAGARARARRMVLAAYGARASAVRRGRRPRRMSAALAGSLLVLLALGTSGLAAGPARVADWVGERLHLSDAPPRDARPASVVDLPGGGRLLVRGEAGIWIIGRGPARRVGGPADQVAWSAFGRYLARARGGRLQAVALNGRVAWTQTYPGGVNAPAWSPDGYRIAFRLDGRMHVISGDGTGAHPLRALGSTRALHSLAVPAAWRPSAMHELAVLDAPGRITFIDADGGLVAWRARAPREALALSWSRDGRRLLAVGRHGWRLYDGQGRVLGERDAADRMNLLAGELSPSGRQVALLAQREPRAGQAAVREATLGRVGGGAHASRVLMAGHELAGVRFSPDGRWLLVEWPRTDSWFFFATTPGHERNRLITGLTTRLSERRPRVEGWCCTSTPRGG